MRKWAPFGVVIVLLGLFVAVPGPAVAGPCVKPSGVYKDAASWAQRVTDAKDVWPLTNGSGQVVAVVGTGVDPHNKQLAGHVSVLGAGGDDCDGRGTFAAGIVGAKPDPATTFAGVAPGARLLAVKYTQALSSGSDADPDPNALATAINDSVGAGATVILVVLPAYRSSPALVGAVRNALHAGVVVVAPALATEAGVTSYPTSMPGVLGVAAVDQSGSALQAESGKYITLAAPGGGDVVSTSAKTSGVGHIWGLTEHPPIYASAAYVAGAVALLRSYRPDLTPAEVTSRLVATANRAPGGGQDPKLGWGVLDLAAAVTDEMPTTRTSDPRPAFVVPAPVAMGPAPHSRVPGWLAIGGVLLGVAAIIGVRVYRRGRARGWRP